MSHPFGDLVKQHLSRKHGLSQSKLAMGIDQDPAVISAMCHGKRLTGPQTRERVLAVISWFHKQGALSSLQEANALLEAAGLAALSPDCETEAWLASRLDKAAGRRTEDVPAGEDEAQPRTRRPWAAPLVVALIVVLAAAAGWTVWSGQRPRPPFWQENFDPLGEDRWQHLQTTAIWEDLPGPLAVLRENDPDRAYGKVESVPLTVNVDDYPILRIHVVDVEPGTSYTVQVLDKGTNVWWDVLGEISYPGEHAIHLGKALGWQGVHTFTLNLWIGGEAKRVIMERISIEPESRAP